MTILYQIKADSNSILVIARNDIQYIVFKKLLTSLRLKALTLDWMKKG